MMLVRSLVLLALSALLGSSMAYDAQFLCKRNEDSYDNSHCEQDLGQGVTPNKQMMQTMHSCIWDVTGGAVGISLMRLDTSDDDGGNRNLRAGVEDFEERRELFTINDCLDGCPCDLPICCVLGFCGDTCGCKCGCAGDRRLEPSFVEPTITLGNGTDVTIANLNAYLATECTKEVKVLANLYWEVGNHCLGEPDDHMQCNVVVS